MANRARTALVGACLVVAAIAWLPAASAAGGGLESAREELRLRVETERRMREEFEGLLARGAMSAAEIADFESYLARLGALVDAQRREVARLEGTAAPTATSAAGALPGDFDRGRTDAENIAMLDAELGSSLSAFDEKLLREQEELSEKSRAASTGEGGAAGGEGSSGGSGDGQGQGRQGGGANGQSGSSGTESADAGGQEGDTSGQRAGAEEQGDEAGEGGEGADGTGGREQVAAAGGTGSGGQEGDSPVTPADIPDGSDDDIVARQLREAAESEQDPELREKLWEEYRKYKKRTP
jgi:hypothetical protein